MRKSWDISVIAGHRKPLIYKIIDTQAPSVPAVISAGDFVLWVLEDHIRFDANLVTYGINVKHARSLSTWNLDGDFHVACFLTDEFVPLILLVDDRNRVMIEFSPALTQSDKLEFIMSDGIVSLVILDDVPCYLDGVRNCPYCRPTCIAKRRLLGLNIPKKQEPQPL